MALNTLLGVGVTVTFSAGCWQLSRLRWKEALVAERKDSLLGRPVPTEQFGPGTPFHTLVALTGHFAPAEAAFVGPRPPPNSADPLPRQNPPGYEVGVLVTTPFLVDDSQMEQSPPPKAGLLARLWGTGAAQAPPRYRVLVNRGWIPWLHYEQWKQSGRPPSYLLKEDTRLWAVTQPDEEEKAETMFPVPGIHGRVRAGTILGATAVKTPEPPTSITQFHLEAVDINSFEHGTDPTLPLFKRDMPVTRYSREFMHGYVSPEKHREYALFWMGSCLAICALAYAGRRSATAVKRQSPRLK